MAIDAETMASGSPLLPVAPFVGRELELETLERAFVDSVDQPCIVCVRGPSGIGKTALVRELLRRVADRHSSTLVVSGRCYQQEAVPFEALDSIVDGLTERMRMSGGLADLLPRDVAELARVFPVLRRLEPVAQARPPAAAGDPGESRRRAFAAMRELVGRLAGKHRLCLFIDDARWGDLDSAILLSEVLAPPSPPPILLVTCHRDEPLPAGSFLPTLRSALPAAVRDLEVSPLSDDEARRLALALFAHRPLATDENAARVARQSGGSPFFVGELVRGLELLADRPVARAAPSPPTGLSDVLGLRLAELSSDARRVLTLAAVAGRPVARKGVQVAAGLDPEGGARVVAELTARHLLRSLRDGDAEALETYHDRMRDAVIRAVAPAELPELHRRLAEALEEAGAEPERLADHWRHAGDPERAARHAIRAAEQAAEALAFDRAADLYGLALELRPDLPPAERRALLVRGGHALANAGRGREAADCYLAAADGAEALEAIDLRRRAAEKLLFNCALAQGLEVARPLLKDARVERGRIRLVASIMARRVRLRLRGLRFRERPASEVPPLELAEIDVLWSLGMGLSLMDSVRAAAFHSRAVLLALDAGEPFRLSRALCTAAGHTASAGARRRARDLLRLGVNLAERTGRNDALGWATGTAGLVAFLSGRWKEARDLCVRAGELLRNDCFDVTWTLDTATFYELQSLYWLGEIGELGRRVPGVVRDAHQRGDRYAEMVNLVSRTNVLWLAADDPDGAARQVELGIGGWEPDHFYIPHYHARISRALIDLYRGDGEGAFARLETMPRDLRGSMLHHVQFIRLRAWFDRARAALAAAGASPSARARYLATCGADLRRIVGERVPWSNALALLLRASIAHATGDTPQAVALMEKAEDSLLSLDMKLYAAVARRRLGELVGGMRGAELVRRADGWMRSQEIRAPERLAAAFLPLPAPERGARGDAGALGAKG